MKAISFAELTKQVHLINDLILADMICGNDDTAKNTITFSRHLLATKYWFARISWANKKRYLLALLEDVRSAWVLSLLLKSMWNCQPKDAVLSISEYNVWSSYDQVPTDHNRTALPVTTLAQVMKNDRVWFLTLEPEPQAMVLSELLTISGGPIMWAVLRRAQTLYQRYREQQLLNLQECVVLNDPPPDKGAKPSSPEKGKKEPTPRRKISNSSPMSEAAKQAPLPSQAQKKLEANLAIWDSVINSLRDGLKLEEVEMTFTDGTKKKLWKVNRPKPEDIETVDFFQLLPSHIAKRILSYLPRAQIGDYSRVNKYWAYIVEEFRGELGAKLKIDADLGKLNEMMLRYDTSLEMLDPMELNPARLCSLGANSTALSARRPPPSIRVSEKSGDVYSMRRFLNEKLNKPGYVQQTPLRNLAELSERLDRRGAADENIWKWCENVLKEKVNLLQKAKIETKEETECGVLPISNVHFPCPMMNQSLKVPLTPPLYIDPASTSNTKVQKNVCNAKLIDSKKECINKRYSLWTRDFSSLYPVFKIPSYQSPV